MAERPAIVRREWRDRRRARLWWAVGLVLYVAMILAVWPSLEGNESFADVAADYPEAIKALFGGSDSFDAITTPAGFLNSYVFSFMLPLLLVVLAVGLGASLIGGEHEEGLLELVLAQPVRRGRVALEQAAVVAAQVAVVTVAVLVVVLAAGPAVGIDVAVTGVLAAGVGSVLYGILAGLVALLGGAVTGRRGSALAVGAVVAVLGYLLVTLADLASWAEPLRLASPLHHATAGDPVVNGMPANYLVLLAACLVSAAATAVALERRDLS